MSGKQIFLLGGIALFFILLLSWGKITGSIGGTWRETAIVCLPTGHTNVAQHIHAQLMITVDAVEEVIPGNIGIEPNCMAEVHTHDGSGELHIETIEADTRHPLKDFFAVWNQPLLREGYTLSLVVDGIPNSAGGELILKEGQRIEMRYESPEFIQVRDAVEEENPFTKENEEEVQGTGGLQLQ